MPFDRWLQNLKDSELTELFDDLMAEFADRDMDIEEIYREQHPDQMRSNCKPKRTPRSKP